jgi:hypothetical protein
LKSDISILNFNYIQLHQGSILETIHVKSLFLSDVLLDQMTDEIRKEYKTFVQILKSNHAELPTIYTHEASHDHNFLLYSKGHAIVAFQYFLYQNEICELFNVYVDSQFRRQSIATKLFLTSVRTADFDGVNRFIIPMYPKNENRNMLINKYRQTVKEHLPNSCFTIYEDAEMAVVE